MRKLCSFQESTMGSSVLIRHGAVISVEKFRHSLISNIILIKISAHTFHLGVTKNLAFRTYGACFDHIHGLQAKLTIDTFHPLAIWVLVLNFDITLSMGPLSVMRLWIIPRDDLKDILLSDVRHYKFGSQFFWCRVSSGFSADLLSPMLFPCRFAPFGFGGVLLRLIVPFWCVLAYKIFPVLPSLFFL